MREENITIKESQIEEFILENFKEECILEISYNRVFIPGKIINIINDDGLIITLQLMGELLHQTVDVDISDIKSEIVELRHTSDDEVLVITVVDDG